MTSRLEQAKAGHAAAIASLLGQALQPEGIQVRGKRQYDHLILWLESQQPVDQTRIVNLIQQGVQRLEIDSIRVVQIQNQVGQHIVWSKTITCSAAASAESSDSGQSDPASKLAQTYHDLTADPAASLAAIEAAYAQLSWELLRQGQRGAVAELKAAHAQLRDRFQTVAPEEPATELDPTETAIHTLVEQMQAHGLEGRARYHEGQLQIRIEPASASRPRRVTAILYTLLEQHPVILNCASVSAVMVYGLESPRKIAWKTAIPLPPVETVDDRDLLSFRNRHINTFGLPVLLLLGMGMNALPLVSFLLRGIKIWFHEFGHATIAWLAGRQAIPLPFGWTNVGAERSWFVYGGLLLLFGLLFRAGHRERLRWPMMLAAGLVLLQFGLTWLLPEAEFETWLAFGGIGGEFYLCTLLIISFYWPLPAYWRWDFYRYPVVLGAAFTFLGQFWLWRQIQQGLEDIPWGSMWGGPDDGDMNTLSNTGWSDQQIIDTYTLLGNVCLIAILSVYFYVAIRQNRPYWYGLLQRWLARHA